MSAVSSNFRAQYSLHSEKSAISLSLKMCPSNQSPLTISVQVWNSKLVLSPTYPMASPLKKF